jgi:signal transduction histidine kinase
MASAKNTLKWRFDVNTFRLLGRDLITDRIVALFELVKNAYDANAENVKIQYSNVSSLQGANRKIIIQDDGIGMSLDDIQNKWMVIGTNSKRNSFFSPKPYKRRYIGEKGIGRFAVDKLGQLLRIRTKRLQDEKELIVTINWQTYEDLATISHSELQLFTDIENQFEFVEPTFAHGTILEILMPREIWTLNDIQRADSELSRLVSPFYTSKYPFNIFIQATEFEPFCDIKRVFKDEKQFASHHFELNFDESANTQDVLFFDSAEQKVVIRSQAKPSFGFIKFYLYYFDSDAKTRFNTHYKGVEVKIDGIKIYRDGMLTTPFAEYEANDEKRKDLFGINKRRWRATFDRMGTRDCIGFIEITREGNPQIIDATSRQAFLATPAFSELQEFVYAQLDTFMQTRKVEREEKTKERLNAFDSTKGLMEDLQKKLKQLRNTKSESKQKAIVADIQETLPQIQEGFEAISSEIQETKKESERKEKMYFSLMSLSLFAANISHAVRTAIYAIRDDATYIQRKIENPNLKNKAERIAREIQRLTKAVDFMLKYAKTDMPTTFFNVKTLIESVFEAHETIFKQKRIDFTLKLEPNLALYGNEIFFQDIITNLVSNSIKAVEGNFHRTIHCNMTSDAKQITLFFSDNGVGIPPAKREWVFEMFNTTTQEQGGAGIGLYIVKTNLEVFGGTVSIPDDAQPDIGTTLKITIPFKK